MTKARSTAKKAKLLAAGDVLKTSALGYWGCAVVLKARSSALAFEQVCHIGITTAIFDHDYALDELDLRALALVHDDEGVPCIGLWNRRITPAVRVIGRTDPKGLTKARLSFKIGDGKDGGWPLCGLVKDGLGYEAVHAWRRVHDAKRWKADVAKAEASHAAMIARLKEEDRAKRARAKQKRATSKPTR